MGEYKHWRYLVDEEGIGWLTFDHADKPLNVLSRETLEELAMVFGEVEGQIGGGKLKGLVLASGKENGFIAGADVTEFEQISDERQVLEHLRLVNALFNRIEALPLPRVAAIHGFCLGGGLELALTADYLIAAGDESTRLGFPEIKLGLFPGFGGTVRSVRKLGGVTAMRLMLGGRTISAAAAKRIGLVEQIVPGRLYLRWAARKVVLSGRRRKNPPLFRRLSNAAPFRQLLARRMLRTVRRKVRAEHYPAPYALIKLWAKHGGSPTKMARRESLAFAPLMVGDSARGLRRAFFLGEELKKQGGKSDFKPLRVHVIGAGVMGGDIAAWCVGCGMLATLQDNDVKALLSAERRAVAAFRRRCRSQLELAATRKRLVLDFEGNGVGRADVVIEAIVEKVDAKRTLLKKIEPLLKPSAVLATNTSSLCLEELTPSLAAPQRLIGLHFFNPVARLPLVEVVRGKKTATDWITKGCAFVKAIKKSPLVVKSAPGFLVNRILAPYMFAALTMLEKGVGKEDIDEAAIAFGMPVGPIELCDRVGLDICLDVARTLGFTEGDEKLTRMVKNGELGRKSGTGFYAWKKGRKLAAVRASSSPLRLRKLAEELVTPMIKAARACLRQGIVPDKDLVDAGIIFGAGFAPFSGGILHYAENAK